jgi:hypothetical protein
MSEVLVASRSAVSRDDMVEHSRVDHVSAAFIAYSMNKALRLT